MNLGEIIPDLQKALEVHFIQEALFELVEEKQHYAPLLVVNHQDKFLSLSNKDHYLILLPFASAEIIKEATEYSCYIFNRKKQFIQLENDKERTGLENHFKLKISDIIVQAGKNGIDKKNIYLLKLRDALITAIDSSTKT